MVSSTKNGFQVGDAQKQSFRKKVSENMCFTKEQWTVIDACISNKCAEGRVPGFFDECHLPNLDVSHLGIVLKHTLGYWHLLMDLFSPEGHGVNDEISRQLCSLSYVSENSAAKIVTQLG